MQLKVCMLEREEINWHLALTDRHSIDLSKTEEVLRPFLLACETKQVKLVSIAIGCLQRLITFHAIPEV